MDFEVFSGVAQRRGQQVELCLLGDSAGSPEERSPLLPTQEPGAEGWWRCRRDDLEPGQRYGLRLGGGPLLLNPYAQAVLPSTHPEAPGGLLSLIPQADFDWGNDAPPQRPWSETVIYETHVKGMTARCPFVPEELRGTYLGLAHEDIVEHFVSLGITAVELMPVAAFLTEDRLKALGLTNYWGYNPATFLAPHPGYATAPGLAADPSAPVTELKTLVRTLHQVGLEVILDVVLNHTAEGPRTGLYQGPTLSLRGLDEAAYYRLAPGTPPKTEPTNIDWTGCGNTIDASSPPARHLIRATLRHWVREYHVDGFRFDLAPVLGRGPTEGDPSFDAGHPLLREIANDPVLAGIKLIAEPWDLGPDGYNLGNFPAPWAEWNDRFRDTARAFWNGDRGAEQAALPDLLCRLGGSSDLSFSTEPAPPHPSIDFLTCHDGFTLEDLLSYDHKHNHANGEDGRDGHGHNLSSNHGAEGPTNDPAILVRREQTARALLATLAMTAGVPMLSHGDELGRSQQGNNNAYCQDSELTWVDWTLEQPHQERLGFVRRLFALRRQIGARSPSPPAPRRRGE